MADERDPKVSQHYRSLGAEEPPASLDQSILATAQRAADRPHAPLLTPAGRHRWYFSLAAAAVIVLAVAVALHIDRDRPDPEALGATQPETTQKAEPQRGPGMERRESAPLPNTPAAQPEERRALPPASAAADSVTPEASPQPSAPRAMARGPELASIAQTPEQWLERIAKLRADGRHDEADRELAEFRRRNPEYRIPEPLLEKLERK